MSFNLLEMVQSQVGDQLLGTASKFLGESEEKTGSAIGAALPALLGGIAEKGSTEDGAKGIMDLIGGMDKNSMGDVAGLLGGGTDAISGLMNSGGGLLSNLLGDKLGGILGLVSKVSGLGKNSSSSLMKMAAPLVMSVLGKKVMGDGLGASGLMNMLSGQSQNISAGMPSGMGNIFGTLTGLAKGALGVAGDTGKAAVDMTGDAIGAVGDGAKNVASGAVNLAGDAVDVVGDTVGAVGRGAKNVASGAADLAGDAAEVGVKTGKSLLKWLLPLFLLLLLASYFGFRTGCSAVDDTVNSTKDGIGVVTEGVGDAAGAVAGGVADAAKGAVDMTGRALSATGDFLGNVLSNVNEAGKAAMDKITFAAGSVGSQMKSFIEGGGTGDNRFTFNNLTFATGSADIADASKSELNNLVSILKAYPGIKIAIEGYTDNTGDSSINATLSQNRADAVKRYLAVNGISQNRIVSNGWGSANPVASNDTEEGRQKNRRTEVRIVQ